MERKEEDNNMNTDNTNYTREFNTKFSNLSEGYQKHIMLIIKTLEFAQFVYNQENEIA